jgi:hypothetical protein
MYGNGTSTRGVFGPWFKVSRANLGLGGGKFVLRHSASQRRVEVTERYACGWRLMGQAGSSPSVKYYNYR